MARWIAITLTALCMSGCAGFNKAARQAGGAGNITDEVSGFDGARLISMSPAPVSGTKGTFSSCCSIGVTWSPSVPTDAILFAQLTTIASIESVKLNLDGQILELPTVSKATSFSTGARTSYKGFAVGWATVKAIGHAKLARVLITTHTKGSISGDLKVSDGGLFIDFLPDFIAKVQSVMP